jgi:2-iminoacetate synthase
MTPQILSPKDLEKPFIDRDKLYELIAGPAPSALRVKEILNKALRLRGLSLGETAELLRVDDPQATQEMLEAAGKAKLEIYGKRLVFFAPVYTGNKCVNNCTYCAFRRDNTGLRRLVLNQAQIQSEVECLLKEGHKRILLICGESNENDTDYMVEAIRTSYAARYNGNYVRRINLELAPTTVDNFAKLHAEKIGTYVCFQETYDPILYKEYHPSGPKANYDYRVTVFDRAMLGGINDVGLGALFGLADYRFEVLALMEHAAHLERVFGVGPHTVSVPRIEPAEGVPLSVAAPHAVSDADFKKLVAIIRLALPYTGIILSTRESEAMRTELFQYGISQISAGSRTDPGAYAEDAKGEGAHAGAQFSLGDHRSLDEVVSCIVGQGYIPSFCTGCYRKGRVGKDFMDLAKPGLIKQYCMPNALFTFQEYLRDFASAETRERGDELTKRMIEGIESAELAARVREGVDQVAAGSRDIYF